MDVGSDVISKKEFLNLIDMGWHPFAIGALNTLEAEDRVDFFDYLAAVYNYCTLDQAKLCAHTFALADVDGSGRLSLEELTTLVKSRVFLNVALLGRLSEHP